MSADTLREKLAGLKLEKQQDTLDRVLESSKSLLSDVPLLQRKSNCVGPVKDLQSHVPEQWWKTVFSDYLYLKTDGDVVEDQDITREEVNLLELIPEVKNVFSKGSSAYGNNGNSSLEEPGKILDLCCGQGRHSLYILKEYPHLRVYGHDQSSYLISLAVERAVFQNFQVPPVFTVGDCRKVPYPDQTFDLIITMGNSFGYFSEDSQDKNVLAEAYRLLAPGGTLVLDLTDGDYMRHNFAQKSWEWADETTIVCRERQLSPDGLRLFSREIISNTTKGVLRDQFYQERLYSRAELVGLITQAGFQVKPWDEVRDNVTLGTDMSKRGEDLGMMGNRLLLVAMKPESTLERASSQIVQIERKKIEPPAFDEITIIMGDPSKPCVGKLNDTWNEEDHATREKLFDALKQGGVPTEKIRVLSVHDQLIQQLLDDKPSFVFNLCDEGFNNDALCELHVPALLESLGVPYSGAGPNCLAFCYDKGLVNRSAEAIGVPTAREITFLPNSHQDYQTQVQLLCQRVKTQMGFPAFVKPIKGDNSLGITARSIVQSPEDLQAYLDELSSRGMRDVLIQEYLSGTEYGVGVIGNVETGFEFLPILEVDFSKIVEQKLPPILGYESKWDPNSAYWTGIGYKKAKLAPTIEASLKKACVQLWERFGCRDYARFDFRADLGRGDGFDGLHGKIKLLEVNPNPGWCWDGKLAYMAKLGGYEYADLLNLILNAAYERIRK
ncbi:S-adenosyl-L-methionine-dependent methyltransferase [Gorgonomyces haynaldii]|nr:S-adenosyl-L-methionine-dependent methyltransferase [Gorgonomyces haynaldii]